jgi:hypothetical protein
MEVGGTDKPFAALASDVYAWAKAETKPTYTADEIDGLAGYIAGKVQDTNTTYTFTIKEATGELEITSHELNGNASTVATFDVVSHAELDAKLTGWVSKTELVEALAPYMTIAAFNEFKEANTTAIADATKAASTAASTALGEYKTANDAALAGVKATADAAAVKTEVETALAGKVDVVEGKSLVDNAEIARLATLVNYDDTAIKADIKANADAIDAIEADYLKAADKTELANAISAEASRADAAEKKALADAKAYADEIKADLLGDDLADTFNTLKDVQDWVNTHGVEATNLSTALAAETKAREDADAALDTRIKAYEDVAATYATKAEVEAVSAVADAAQTADEVASAIDTKIAALDLANTYDAKGAADAALEAAKAYADTLDHEDTTYTAGAGLKLDGTVFSIDTDLVFILDANA